MLLLHYRLLLRKTCIYLSVYLITSVRIYSFIYLSVDVPFLCLFSVSLAYQLEREDCEVNRNAARHR